MSRKVSGFRAWVIQRATAIYLAIYFIYLLLHFAIEPPVNYEAWRSWLDDPYVSIGAAIFFLSLLLHAWIGVRDVVIDYVHPLGIRLAVLSLVALVLLASGFWLFRSLIVVAL